MTDAILGVLVEKSISLIENEFATLTGLRKKAENLRNTLTRIRVVLEDAEEKQMTNGTVKDWLRELKDAAHVMEDILEDCASECLQHAGSSSFKPKNIMFRYRVGHKLKEMKEKLDKIAKAKNDFGLREGVSRERPSEVAEWRQTTSTITTPQVYGREEDKEKVLKFLLSPDQGSDYLSVYAIIGLGGLGKTTLSQLVYNDPYVSSCFNLRIWVCVSENFTKKQILRSIIESVEETCNISNLDVMERKVQELLQSKIYLLVLDDVWKKSQKMEFGLIEDEWDKLRSVLSCGSKGSSILVSSRDMDVATIMRACQTHELSGLSDEHCWSLFKQRAFDKEEHQELVKIGKEIVKKCGGSPLAALALGGVMRTRSGEKQWLEVLKSELWTLPEKNDILPALRLSYFHLTPTSKQCFAFCAIFPKDREIKKQDLIHLWMANGFISSRENLDVEEVGNMVWNELYQKSFFQDVRTDYLGDISSFKMHDLVHDLALSITEKECVFLKEKNLKDLPINTHHIGFDKLAQTTINEEDFEKFDSLRTLYGKPEYFNTPISVRFRIPSSIRVLGTSSLNSWLLGNPTHLRYLQLYDFELKTLPDSIYNLCKLEVLKLTSLHCLRCLPKHLTRLKNLRHLLIEACFSISCMFPNIHKLSHLRTLSVYIVKTETGHSLTELRDLNLGGELTIKGLGNVGTVCDAQDANLKGKGDLRVLSLSWEESDETKSNATDVGQVLEALQPHPNLKSLEISNYKGLHWPSWMGNNSSILNNLVSLKLCICENCVQLPPLGKLPYLKTLFLYEMKCVQYVEGDESYEDGVEMRAFPSLETLIVERLPNLERLLKMETRDDMFPRLSSLLIDNCPKLQLSLLPCVKDLKVYGCNNELLKSIFCLNTLHSLSLANSEDMTSFPEGMMNNLTSFKRLTISSFRKLKELPCEITKLIALESLTIENCDELESFPEQGMEDLCSLRSLNISWCNGLRCLPDGVRHLTSLEDLTIRDCPTLKKRCEEGTGEDWPKIAHIPKVTLMEW